MLRQLARVPFVLSARVKLEDCDEFLNEASLNLCDLNMMNYFGYVRKSAFIQLAFQLAFKRN